MEKNKAQTRFIQNLQHLQLLRINEVEDEESLFSSIREIIGEGKGEQSISLDLAMQIANFYKIPLDALLKQDFSELTEIEYARLFPNSQKTFMLSEEYETISISFVSKAQAGSYIETTDPVGFPELVLPKRLFPGISLKNYRAFEITGKSMLPDIEPGSIVVAELLEEKDDIKDGLRYVIIQHDGILLKRLYHAEDFAQSGKFRLVSDNPEESDMTVHKDQIKEIWLPKMIMDAFPETF